MVAWLATTIQREKKVAAKEAERAEKAAARQARAAAAREAAAAEAVAARAREVKAAAAREAAEERRAAEAAVRAAAPPAWTSWMVMLLPKPGKPLDELSKRRDIYLQPHGLKLFMNGLKPEYDAVMSEARERRGGDRRGEGSAAACAEARSSTSAGAA